MAQEKKENILVEGAKRDPVKAKETQESLHNPTGNKSKVKRANVSEKQIKILALRNGNRCSRAGCPQNLVVEATQADDASLVGVIAHIKGENQGAARYDASLSPKQRNHASNLMFLCPTCHKIIDDQPNTYTVELLQKMKRDHESLVARGFELAMTEVTDRELTTVTRFLVADIIVAEDGFLPLDPTLKMKKNCLTDSVLNFLEIGAAEMRQVRHFIKSMNQLAPNFSDRLRSGFVAAYNGFVAKGANGDTLFADMVAYSCRNCKTEVERAAGLAVLAYLFQTCDVFES